MAQLDLDFNELNRLEMALLTYQGCLEQSLDGRPTIQHEHEAAGQLLIRVRDALGYVADDYEYWQGVIDE